MLSHETIMSSVMDSLHSEAVRLSQSQADEVELFSIEYLLSNLFRKLKGNSKDANKAALQTWEDCEIQCYHTNERILRHNWESNPLIARAARICKSILGVAPSLEEACPGGLTNNATYDHKFGTHKSIKVKREATISTNALLWVHSRTNPWYDNNFVVVKGNRLSFVPKTSETSRPIAVEPTFNVSYQLRMGQLVRKHLKRVGIDLNDQSRNRNAAQCAWRTREATIDLKSASDTLSFETVRCILPPDWFKLLAELRSPMTRMPNGKWRYLEKFSSMGNGFNFEIETLIFFCICKACGVKKPLVYGDDIIVPQDDAPLVIKALEFFGFSINLEKSFTSGNFFESCGGHYLYGLDVTPAYQKEHLTTAYEIVRFHNRLYRWALRDPYHRYDNIRFKVVSKTLRYLRRLVPDTHIPDHLDRDDGFLRPTSSFRTTVRFGEPVFLCKILRNDIHRKPLSQDGAYRYKLIHPSELNASERGYTRYHVNIERLPEDPVKDIFISV